MRILFHDALVISPDVELEGASVLVEDGVIRRIYLCGEELPPSDRVVEVQGDMLVPGFIDIHTHGCGGQDFSHGSREAIRTIAKNKLSEGVTTLLPSTSTQSEETLARALQSAADYVKSENRGAKLPGVHLEGVFINPHCLGAQNPSYLRNPDIEEVQRLNRIFPVRKVSYAVEMPGAIPFTAELLEHGIVPSCVHSAATCAQFTGAYEHGMRNLTHFCNQMTPLKHREIGLVGAGFLYEDVYLELICDTLHVCPDMINLIFQIKSVDRIMLITDSVEASGMAEGEYTLAGLPIILKDGAVRLKDQPETLAGSVLTMNAALRNVYEITGYPLKDLIKTTSWNQAQSLWKEWDVFSRDMLRTLRCFPETLKWNACLWTEKSAIARDNRGGGCSVSYFFPGSS